jgi:hypothetical protein
MQAPAQPKPTEVTGIIHFYGHLRQYESFMATPNLIKFKCKTRTKKLTKMKPQKRS